jgi:hypothetical protein
MSIGQWGSGMRRLKVKCLLKDGGSREIFEENLMREGVLGEKSESV